MNKAFLSVLTRDLLLAYRHWFELSYSWLFFIIVISLFPLAVSPESSLLHQIAPGVIWIAALLSSLLGLERLFRIDFLEGSLEQYILSAQPLGWIISAKILAHWLVTGLPIILLTPIVAYALHCSLNETILLMMSLLLGTPILSAMGSIIVSLTLGLREGSVLLALLLLPIYIPVLIFGVGVVNTIGASPVVEFALLGAILIFILPIAPIVSASALRINIG